MPTLHFKGKTFVQNHHLAVPYCQLVPDKKKSLTDKVSLHDNLIIHGDNLKALKALLPLYAGKIKCIYIDPPYNIGEENWVYNDNVNSPMIKEWLGKIVDKEDLTRHDKWLCMMMPRLKLLRDLLSDDGVIFVSIDDNEHQHMRIILDEIFSYENFVSCFVWQKRYSRENREAVGDVHEYILLYEKTKNAFKKYRNLIKPSEDQLKVYKNPNNDPRGRWRGIPITAQAGHATKEQFYEIELPSGKKIKPPEGRCWGLSEKTFLELKANGKISFGKKGNSQPNVIRYLDEIEGYVPWTWWPHEEVGHTDEAKKEIREYLGKSLLFDNPKPTRLLKRILELSTDKNSLILDSFAGSGTTAHAVLALNKEDDGNRKFILVECENYADKITAERVRHVIKGVK
jgi:adenine-specific DNA-methyltransferase